MIPNLRVECDLKIEVSGHGLTLRSLPEEQHQVLDLHLPSLSAAIALGREVGRLSGQSLIQLNDVLNGAGVALQITMGGRSLARFSGLSQLSALRSALTRLAQR